MNDLLRDAIALAGQGWFIVAIVFLRVGAAMALLPGFAERQIPVMLRLALAVAFTLVVAPGAAEHIPDRAGVAFALKCLATETVAGLLIGIGLRLMILALETAGTIAAQSTSLAQMFPGAAEPMPAMSHLLVWAGLCLAVIGGLHVRISEVLLGSYIVLTPGSFPGADALRGWGVGQVAGAFALALRVAAPFVIISFLYNVALGFINRAMPQLMAAYIGAPVISMAALLLMLVAVPSGLLVWMHAFSDLLSDPFGGP